MKITNKFHNTECRSNLAGCADLTELDFYSSNENPDNKKYARTRAAIVKKLCPHNGKSCSCWSMTTVEQ